MSIDRAEGAPALPELELPETDLLVDEVEAAPETIGTVDKESSGQAGSLSYLPAALALRERLVAHGLELADEAQLSEVPGNVLDLLLAVLPAQPGPRLSEAELKAELAERVAQAHRLPRGVRDRLAGMLESVQFDDSGRDEPALRVSDAVALLEESLPQSVLLAASDVHAAPHPRGDAFFTGDPSSLSDDDARRIAAEQLARTGYR
jgi:hypothetical protein